MTTPVLTDIAPLLPGAVLIPSPLVAEAVGSSRWPLHALRGTKSASASLAVEPPEGMRDSMRRWASDMNVPVASESVALALIDELNAPLGSEWCSCSEPRVPRRRRFTWEDHQWGACGWPVDQCTDRQHRLTRCRACGNALRYQVCEFESGGTGYSRDEGRGWWVHEVCGWPSPDYLAGNVDALPPDLDGTPTTVWRVFRRRPPADARLMPFPTAEAERRDSEMDGATYLD